MRLRACAALLASLVCAVILGACQGSSPLEQQQGTTLSPISTQEPGAGVDPALWAKLTAELNRVLEQQGTAKRTSAGPIGKGSQVQNLSVHGSGGMTVYEWNYRNQGDYDLNGVVNISDLTQVGLFFNKDTLSPDWQQAQLADGDGNGVVNIGDVTPIGQNFGGQVDGYEFQSRPGGPGTDYATVEDYPFVAGDKTTGLYPGYTRTTLPSLVGPTYRVVPYVNTGGGGRDYGVPSVEYVTSSAGRSNWPTFRSNNFRNGLAQANGPADVGEVWETQLEGQVVFQEPVSDYLGSIYIGTATSLGTTAFDSTGNFYALDQDGNILWRFKTAGGVAGTAAVNRLGEIVFGDTTGLVYCLTRDGKQLWRRQLSGIIVFSNVLLDDSGNAFLASHTLSGGSISGSNLYRLNPDGTVSWSRPTNDVSMVPPFYNINFDVCTIDQSGEMYEFDYAGNSTFDFMLPDTVESNLFASNVVSVGAGVLYGDSSNNLRVHFYNNSGGAATAMGEEALTSPALNTQGHIIIGTRTTAVDPELRLNYYIGAAQDWEITPGGSLISNIAVDQSDRMYFTTYLDQDGAPTNNNGISCVLPDQTIAWFYPTGTKLAFSPTVVGENLLVCIGISALHTEQADGSIMGIRGS